MTIGFVIFMSLLAWLSPRKFVYIYVMVLGVAVQLGYQMGMVGMLVWWGIGKVLNDLIYAGTE